MVMELRTFKHEAFFKLRGADGGGLISGTNHVTHLTGLLVRVPLDPLELHEVEGTGQGTQLSGVLHVLLIVKDLSTG